MVIPNSEVPYKLCNLAAFVSIDSVESRDHRGKEEGQVERGFKVLANFVFVSGLHQKEKRAIQ